MPMIHTTANEQQYVPDKMRTICMVNHSLTHSMEQSPSREAKCMVNTNHNINCSVLN